MQMMIKKTLAEALFISLAAVLLALAVNLLRPDGRPLIFSGQTADPAGSGEPDAAPGAIGLSEAIESFKAGRALFIDARPGPDYEAGHIPGALNLTSTAMDGWMDAFIAETDIDKLIIAYCDGIHCDLGRNLADQLRLDGFQRVYYLKNGWHLWTTGGMPVEAGR